MKSFLKNPVLEALCSVRGIEIVPTKTFRKASEKESKLFEELKSGLTEKQKQLLAEIEETFSIRLGETEFYFYKKGFSDAITLLLIDVPTLKNKIDKLMNSDKDLDM